MKIDSARYLLDFDTRDLPRYTTDVLVVGGGVAGLSAALAAAAHGHVLLLAKDPLEATNTAYAQGGIAAALGRDDTVEAHVADTLRTGGALCDEAVVAAVAGGAPHAVERLRALGARFDTEQPGADDLSAAATGTELDAGAGARPGAGAGGPRAGTRDPGGLALGQEGGHTHRRILHHGDATGLECVRTLRAAVEATPAVHRLPRALMLDFLTAEGRCVGALVWREDGQRFAVFARAVVLAAGGAGRIFRESSNVRGATGDGIAAAFRAGASLKDLEFVQFHPTTLYLAGIERALITEAVRGDGAHVVDNEGRRFLADADPAAELAPRDVVSRAIVEHLARPGVTGVFLDMRHWLAGHAARRFPGLVERCARYGLDPARDLIPVRPAAHYTIGGVACDLDGRTDLPGLYACGEASCTALHGANRLASNSLLEGLVLGDRTGRTAAAEAGRRYDGDLGHRDPRPRADVDGFDLEDLRKSLASRTWRSLGVIRDGPDLLETAEDLGAWRHFLAGQRLDTRGGFELQNQLLLASLLTAAATLRAESRGTHYRRDCPDRDDARFLGSFVWRRGAGEHFVPKGAVAVG